ncbi:transposase [Geobacillus sp. GHH01]|nr:transposase [Geobacillus sp. GHH01]
MDAQEILKLYKGQISVEMNFAFLKDPFFTDEIYVKKSERVAVLGYLFLLALAIYRVFQRRVRQFITPEHPFEGSWRPQADPADGAGNFSAVSICERRPAQAAGWTHPTLTGSLPQPGSAKDSAGIGHG